MFSPVIRETLRCILYLPISCAVYTSTKYWFDASNVIVTGIGHR